MKARHILVAAMGLNLFAVTATAETIVIRPDPCPLPADLPRIIDLGAVDADDLNPDRAAASQVLVLYPLPGRGWASSRLLSRFRVERGFFHGGADRFSCDDRSSTAPRP